MEERYQLVLSFRDEVFKLRDNPNYVIPEDKAVQKKPERPTKFPKHIGYLKRKGEIIGYQIYGFKMPDGKKIGKVFTGVNLTMEEKYEKALNSLKELEVLKEKLVNEDNGSKQQTTSTEDK